MMVAFRLASRLRKNRLEQAPILAQPIGILYRVLFTWLLGIELPWRTRVGSGLKIYHGVGLVINDDVVLGNSVTLRNGVTLGHRFPGDGVPVIGDRVEVGANAVIIGGVRIGNDARIAPGALVLTDIPAGGVAVGNPAIVTRIRSLGCRQSDH
jgi:putative colanic acid biosynthesis acetyltransferase WcaB